MDDPPQLQIKSYNSLIELNSDVSTLEYTQSSMLASSGFYLTDSGSP